MVLGQVCEERVSTFVANQQKLEDPLPHFHGVLDSPDHHEQDSLWSGAGLQTWMCPASFLKGIAFDGLLTKTMRAFSAVYDVWWQKSNLEVLDKRLDYSKPVLVDCCWPAVSPDANNWVEVVQAAKALLKAVYLKASDRCHCMGDPHIHEHRYIGRMISLNSAWQYDLTKAVM